MNMLMRGGVVPIMFDSSSSEILNSIRVLRGPFLPNCLASCNRSSPSVVFILSRHS
jgi:hypothetical protein